MTKIICPHCKQKIDQVSTLTIKQQSHELEEKTYMMKVPPVQDNFYSSIQCPKCAGSLAEHLAKMQSLSERIRSGKEK